MPGTDSVAPAPQHIAVIGAGMIGLATAWFLQERGIQVTVYDRKGVAAGASWGNAGWLTPGITTPLPEPAVLRYGLRAVLSPSSPVYVPLRADIRMLRFMAGFVRHSTAKKWQIAMRAYIPMNRRALESFDTLEAGGVVAGVNEAKSFIAAYQSESERAALLDELKLIHAAGQEIEYDVLTGTEAQDLEPSLSDQVRAGVRLYGQRFINPGQYVHALGDSVLARGASLVTGVDVVDIRDEQSGVRVTTSADAAERYDSVVLATGTWLGELGRRFGIRTVVQAGRGYSFSVPIEHVPTGPVYFPAQRVACTPLGDRLRVAGMMEFRKAEAPLDRRRISAIAEAARPLLRGADLDARTDEWVGSRPCTPDGLPLIGRTRSPRVFAAGGHGMWGITLGPLTGQLLAEQITTGRQPAELRPFSPLR